MRSKAERTLIAAALVLGGCSGGWWRDGGRPLPPVDDRPGAALAAGAQGADYPPPDQPTPDLPPDRAVPPAQSYDPASAGPPRAATRYDQVGYATWSDDPGTVAAAHATLPSGSFAEVTSLDSGATILVPITAGARSGAEIELSGAAARQLGLRAGGRAAVRVRAVTPTEADLTALGAGQPAPTRPVTPPVLLNALRHKLDGTAGKAALISPPPRPTARTSAPSVSAPRHRRAGRPRLLRPARRPVQWASRAEPRQIGRRDRPARRRPVPGPARSVRRPARGAGGA